VGGAIHHVWQRLPVPLVGLASACYERLVKP
jgi:hypothetical protein